MTDVFFLNIAEKIGNVIYDRAMWNDERCTWLNRTIKEERKGDQYHYEILGNNIYDGISGIIFFLGYLYSIRKKEHFYRLITGGIEQMLFLSNKIDHPKKLGYYDGTIGLYHTVFRLAKLMKNNRLIEMAIENTKNTFKYINEQHYLDIISGNAGSIPALIEMYKDTDDNTFLEFSIDLGDELITRSTKTKIGWSWDSEANGIYPSIHNLTGFSHGTAGIAYSLLLLFKYTLDKKYLVAAKNAIRYENYWYNSSKTNWPDFRIFEPTGTESGRYVYSNCWCHGAPGISLSRLYAYKLLKEDHYLEDVNKAFKNIKGFSDGSIKLRNYSLCHGYAGIGDILLYASSIISPRYRRIAIALSKSQILRYLEFCLSIDNGNHIMNIPLDLMVGLSGIGYFYLRLYCKDVPSILISDID